MELAAPVLFAALLWLGGMLVVVAGGGRWTSRSVAAALPVGVLVLELHGPAQRIVDYRFGLPSALAGFVVAAAVAAGARVLLRIRWRPALRRPPHLSRHEAWITLSGLIATTTLGGLAVWVAGGGSWETVSQTWDAIFDANAVRYAAESGIVDPTRISDFAYPYPPNVYYPTGFHTLAALQMLVFGGNAVAATNVTAAVIVGGVWASAVVCAVDVVLGPGRVRVLAALLAAVGFHGIWGPFGWGVLWATGLADAMVPLLVAGVAGVLGLTRVPRSRVGCFALLVGALAAIGLAHPRILVVIGVLACAAWSWWCLGRAWLRRPHAGSMALAVAGSLVPWVGAALAGLFLAKRNSSFFARTWDVERSWLAEIAGYVVNGPNATIPNLLVGAAVVVGVVVGSRHPRLRWIAVLYLTAVVLDIVTANLQGVRAYNGIARFWYTDRFRVIGMPPAFGVLLATVGAEAAWLWARRRWTRFRTRTFLAAAVAVLVATVGTWAATDFLSVRYRIAAESPTASLVSRTDREFYAEISRLVRPGERVLNNANDGSALLYAYTGVKPVFYLAGVRSSTLGGEQLWTKLTIMTPKNTCDLLLLDGIRWILNGGEPYRAGVISPQYAPGMQVPDGFYATTLRRESGQLRFYEVTGCPPGGQSG